MQIATTVVQARNIIKGQKKAGKQIGLVPTMGFLHEGHGSLIERSVRENDFTAVSIFVNPMQFAPGEDLESYPRDFEKDRAYCEALGADLIFHPEPEEMYPEHFYSTIQMRVLTEQLCGRSRPTHFQGVCTVICKLFHILDPDRAYFGQKDAQQYAIIRQMVQDLNMDIDVISCPIIREKNGLAKSSRNSYLTEEQAQAALILHQAIVLGEQMIRAGETETAPIVQAMTELILTEPLARIDYVEAVHGETMQPQTAVEPPLLIAIAVFIGKTRLLDNLTV